MVNDNNYYSTNLQEFFRKLHNHTEAALPAFIIQPNTKNILYSNITFISFVVLGL